MTDKWQPYSYPHMCRDDHIQIGHKDSEHEMCPLCRTLAFLRILLGEDDRFQIAVGGNPNVVDRMLADGRKTLNDLVGQTGSRS